MYLFLLTTTTFSCSSSSRAINLEDNLISLNKSKIGDCKEAFNVSQVIESNNNYNQILSSYLYKCFIDNEKCDKDYTDIFSRESFKETVLYIFNSKSFSQIDFYEDSSRWREGYTRLLTYCNNDKALFELADDLLSKNIDDGLITLWDKDFTKLANLKSYVKRNEKEFYNLSLVATLYHNKKLFSKRDEILNIIKNNKLDEDSVLGEMFENSVYIDYMSYVESVFGGI
jgi:hypothetical protein